MKLDRVTFGPFRGYQSAQEAWLSPPDFIIGDITGGSANSSREVVIDANTKLWQRRTGCNIQGDTLTSGLEVKGLLESGMQFGARPRRIFAIDSPSSVSGKSCLATLYSNDTNDAAFPVADHGWCGTCYVRNPNLNENYNLFADFGSLHYPVDGATSGSGFDVAAGGLMIMPPLWYESGEGGYTRGATMQTRRFLTPGSRDVVRSGGLVSFPNLRGTPIVWDGTFNDIATPSARTVRVQPSGPFQPLPSIGITDGGAVALDQQIFKDGDAFFYSVLFKYKDGSFSMPTQPRSPQHGGTLPNGVYYHIVGTPGGANFYQVVNWSQIPIGDDRVAERILLCSPTQNLAAAATVLTISPDDLRPMARIKNNTQTTFADSHQGTGLIANGDVVNLTQIVPRRSRYEWTGDRRVMIGHTLETPHAIRLAVISYGAGQPANQPDNANPGSKAAFYRVTSIALELYSYEGGVFALANTIDWATYTTIQAVVDKINATVTGAGPPITYAWRAQVAPGVDPSTASVNLCPTVRTVANCTSGGAASYQLHTTTTDGFKDVPVGAYIYEVKAGASSVTAGTYVVSKSGTQDMILSAAPNVAPGSTLTFYSFCGDGPTFQVNAQFETTPATPATLVLGMIRTFSDAYSGFIYRKRSSLVDWDKPDRQKVFSTIGSPGSQSLGATTGFNCWGADNVYLPTIPNPGVILGGVDIEGAAIVGYSGGMTIFQNRRGVNTGEDFDYKLWTLNMARGMVAWGGLVGGNGWGAYVTPQGVFGAGRDLREVNLGSRLYNPSRKQGDLTNEIAKSMAATDQDTEDSTLSMAVKGNSIALCYADNENVRSIVFYDFSPGVDASGIEELIDPETKDAYGWSAPCRYNLAVGAGLGVLGTVPSGAGPLFFAAHEGNNASYRDVTAGDGRIDQIDSGDSDNGEAFIGRAFMPHLLSDDFASMSPQRLSVLHRSPSGISGDVSIKFTTTQDFSALTVYPLSNSGTSQHIQEPLQLRTSDRGPVALAWLMWEDAAVYQGNGFWRIAFDYQTLPK